LCSEANDTCAACLADADCDDGRFCSGVERCRNGACLPGEDPCADRMCNESTRQCADCLYDVDCYDDDPCTNDGCDAGRCAHTPRDECKANDNAGEEEAGGIDDATNDNVAEPPIAPAQADLVVRGPSQVAVGTSASFTAEVESEGGDPVDVTQQATWRVLDAAYPIADNVASGAASIAAGVLTPGADLVHDTEVYVVARVSGPSGVQQGHLSVTLVAETAAERSVGRRSGTVNSCGLGFGALLWPTLGAMGLMSPARRSRARRRRESALQRPARAPAR